ncbi:MAG: hypothetical protein C0453_00630 [Comamonadaceae bacterium]|nr:hypothetical protein [Comamonadaceae bacterium]
MSEDRSDNFFPSPNDMANAMNIWQSTYGNGILLACLYQWQMLDLLQRVGGVAQQELLDEWVSRFGGGVPLDG